MEGSESEAIFETFNLNPQLFVNESFNFVDDLLDDAFDCFHDDASKLFKTDGIDRSRDLKSGINCIHSIVQEALDKGLDRWEKYCLRHCFAVPSGFSLPSEKETSGDDPMHEDDLSNEQVDAELDRLRNKLAEAEKECADLNQERKELERYSAMSNHFISAVNEALQLYDNSSAQDMFQEMLRVADELQQKLDHLKTKQNEKNGRKHRGGANDANGVLPNIKLGDLQEFIDEMNL